jgi:hypothetical protein
VAVLPEVERLVRILLGAWLRSTIDDDPSQTSSCMVSNCAASCPVLAPLGPSGALRGMATT